jgi:hypothetical protein
MCVMSSFSHSFEIAIVITKPEKLFILQSTLSLLAPNKTALQYPPSDNFHPYVTNRKDNSMSVVMLGLKKQSFQTSQMLYRYS